MAYNISEILELYQSRKMNRQEIVGKYKVSYTYLCRVIKRAGIDLWDSEKNDKYNIEEIIALYKSRKMNRRGIMKKYGISAGYLRNLITQYQIEPWDIKRKEKPESEYFNWAELANHPLANYNHWDITE